MPPPGQKWEANTEVSQVALRDLSQHWPYDFSLRLLRMLLANFAVRALTTKAKNL
jgi:hypothetical protein